MAMTLHFHRPVILLLVGLACGFAGCATTTQTSSERGAGAVSGAVSQPFRDLSLIRKAVPEVLARAVADPYATSTPVDCDAVSREIGELDAILGPDLKAGGKDKGGDAFDMVAGALSGALDLPFRGVVRKVSGAEKRDRDAARAVLAGMVRRGFLKGQALTAGCPPAS
jgi:hypothetical protein